MRIHLILFFLFICVFQSEAQTDTTVYLETDTVHVTTPPQFEGGPRGFGLFISSHLILSSDVIINGHVYVSFIIEQDGSLTNICIMKGLNSFCDQAVIDAISQSPRWKPGLKNGAPIRVKKVVRVGISKEEVEEVPSKKKKKRS